MVSEKKKKGRYRPAFLFKGGTAHPQPSRGRAKKGRGAPFPKRIAGMRDQYSDLMVVDTTLMSEENP